MPEITEENLPPHWKRASLGEHCERPEYGFTGRAVDEQLGPRLLRITDIQDGLVDWNKVPFVDLEMEKVERYRLNPGDLVLARIGASTGKAFLVCECPDAIFASYLIRIRTKHNLLPEFLNFYFNSFSYWQQISQQKGGRLKGGVTLPIIQKLRIPLPPFPEQRAIAQALRAVQEAKEARQHELALERERKAALMEFLFTHGTRGEPRVRTGIGEFPDSWSLSTLGEISECLDHKRVPVKLGDRNERFGRIPYYGASGLAGWIDDFLFDETLLLVAEDGENLVSRKVPIAYSIEGKSWVNNHAHVLRIVGSNQFFVEYYLNSIDMVPFLGGATRPKLNKAQLMNIPIPLPDDRGEQDEVANALRACDHKIEALDKESGLLDELFRAMLEELMTGRLSAVSLIEQEAAS
jgi:type I restriction enzyme S subunit